MNMKDKRKPSKGTTSYDLKQSFKKSLGQGMIMEDAVRCPKEEELEEWLAMNSL